MIPIFDSAAVDADVSAPYTMTTSMALPADRHSHLQTSRFDRTPWLSWLVLTGVIAVGFLLRLHGLGTKNLWLDEMWSVVVARMPIHSILWSARTQDPNATLYNLVLHYWMRLGSSEGTLRGFSLLCGVGTIPVAYQLGKELAHRLTGLLASGLVAINLFHIEYSQEARAYSLVVLLVCLSSLSFVKYVEKPSRGVWAAYVAFSVMAIYAHIFAVLVLVSQVASLVLLPRRKVPWAGLFGAAAGVTAGTSPLALLVFQRARAPFVAFNWMPRPTVRRVYDLFFSLAGNANYYGIEIRHSVSGKVLLALYCLVCIVTLGLMMRLWRSEAQSPATWRVGFLFVWLFLPIAIVLVVSELFQPWFINRYLLISLPPLAILAAQGICLIRPRWLAITAVVAIAVTEFAMLPQYYHYRADYQEWRTASNYILSYQRPGDAVVFCIAHGRLLFEYYRDQDHANLPRELNLVYPNLENATTDPQALSYFPPLSNQTLASVVGTNPRTWLVLYPNDWVTDTETSRKVQATLASGYPYQQETSEYNVTIRLYSKDGVDSGSPLDAPVLPQNTHVPAEIITPDRTHNPVLTAR